MTDQTTSSTTTTPAPKLSWRERLRHYDKAHPEKKVARYYRWLAKPGNKARRSAYWKAHYKTTRERQLAHSREQIASGYQAKQRKRNAEYYRLKTTVHAITRPHVSKETALSNAYPGLPVQPSVDPAKDFASMVAYKRTLHKLRKTMGRSARNGRIPDSRPSKYKKVIVPKKPEEPAE